MENASYTIVKGLMAIRDWVHDSEGTAGDRKALAAMRAFHRDVVLHDPVDDGYDEGLWRGFHIRDSRTKDCVEFIDRMLAGDRLCDDRQGPQSWSSESNVAGVFLNKFHTGVSVVVNRQDIADADGPDVIADVGLAYDWTLSHEDEMLDAFADADVDPDVIHNFPLWRMEREVVTKPYACDVRNVRSIKLRPMRNQGCAAETDAMLDVLRREGWDVYDGREEKEGYMPASRMDVIVHMDGHETGGKGLAYVKVDRTNDPAYIMDRIKGLLS